MVIGDIAHIGKGLEGFSFQALDALAAHKFVGTRLRSTPLRPRISRCKASTGSRLRGEYDHPDTPSQPKSKNTGKGRKNFPERGKLSTLQSGCGDGRVGLFRVPGDYPAFFSGVGTMIPLSLIRISLRHRKLNNNKIGHFAMPQCSPVWPKKGVVAKEKFDASHSTRMKTLPSPVVNTALTALLGIRVPFELIPSRVNMLSKPWEALSRRTEMAEPLD